MTPNTKVTKPVKKWGKGMKEFIERIKDDWEYETEFNREPFYFKVFLFFVFLFYFIFKGVYAVLCFVTVPIWILPYYIFWKNRNKGDNNV